MLTPANILLVFIYLGLYGGDIDYHCRSLNLNPLQRKTGKGLGKYSENKIILIQCRSKGNISGGGGAHASAGGASR